MSDSYEARRRLYPRIWQSDYRLLRGLRDQVRAFASTFAGASSTVVDFGCGDKPYRPLFPATCGYVGVDIPGNPVADVTYDPTGAVPIEDDSADLVLSTQVLHKVLAFDRYLDECRRMLHPEGRILITTHGMWTFHPASGGDFFRFTQQGLEAALARSGLVVETMVPVIGSLGATIHLRQLLFNGWLQRMHLSPVAGLANIVYNLRIAAAERITPSGAALSSPVVLSAVARPDARGS